MAILSSSLCRTLEVPLCDPLNRLYDINTPIQKESILPPSRVPTQPPPLLMVSSVLPLPHLPRFFPLKLTPSLHLIHSQRDLLLNRHHKPHLQLLHQIRHDFFQSYLKKTNKKLKKVI